MQWPRHFAALSSRNYRLYFAGQIVSLIGTWMTQTASLWLAYHLTSSPFVLGLVGFASMAPIFFLAPFAGVWVDRVNRHRLLIGTQVLSLLQSLALAAFAFTNTMTIAHLLLLCLLQGFIGAFDMPVRQALVVEFVETREHLGNAIALNSSLFNLARLIGPAIGGFVVASFGVGFCFLLDGVSYLAVIAALAAMRMRPRAARPQERHPLVEMREGFSYVFGFVPVRALILLVAAISAVGFSFSVLTPIFARDVFGGDARTLGWLMSASGTGAVLGALYLGGRKTVRGLGNVITLGGGFLSLGLIGFGLSRWLPLSLASLMLAGVGGVLLMASSNTLVQTMVPDDKRGRVMSIFTMAFSGTAPLGNLLAGSVAARIGATPTLIAGGTACMAIVGIFYWNLPGLRAAAAPVLAAVEAESLEPTVFSTEGKKDG
jgi:MFS family permease